MNSDQAIAPIRIPGSLLWVNRVTGCGASDVYVTAVAAGPMGKVN
jgi:hypothetical protein